MHLQALLQLSVVHDDGRARSSKRHKWALTVMATRAQIALSRGHQKLDSETKPAAFRFILLSAMVVSFLSQDIYCAENKIVKSLPSMIETAQGVQEQIVHRLDDRPRVILHGAEWEIDTFLIHLADHIGFARAEQAWVRSFQAVGDLARLVTPMAFLGQCGRTQGTACR
jgi:hypothetical protein